MKTLSGLDASFLYLETAEMPMHIGSFCLYELPPDLKGSWHKAVQAHIARRVHLAPVLNHKLGFMPLNLGHPVWVKVDDVDFDFHIRRVKGKTLTVREAQEECAELHTQLIDRSHPLWEFHVFERIKRPDGTLCAGVYSKIHHAALDGKGGTILTKAIMDISATPRELAPPDSASRDAKETDLSTSAMIGAVFSNSLVQYVKLIKALPQTAKALGNTLIGQSFGRSGNKQQSTSLLSVAPMTNFNVAVSRERAFGIASLPFADCHAMAQAVDGTFNDIVLWICATALRSYLSQHGGIPKKTMLAAMPVSLRELGNKNSNTQATMTVVELGTQYANPMKRLQVIMASTAKVKDAMINLKAFLPTDYPSLLAPWIVGGVAKAAIKAYKGAGLSHRLPMPANLVISNVPGPQVPLYLAGAKMLTFHPMSIAVHGVALNITLQTYAGSVDFGLIGDKEAVPDIEQLTDALVQAFEEGRSLLNVATTTQSRTPASKARVKRHALTERTAPGKASATRTKKAPMPLKPRIWR